MTTELLRGWPLPQPDDDDDKHARGQALVIGGSVLVPGAPLLSGSAALRAGAGKVQVATVDVNAPALGVAFPEALVAGLPATEAGGIAPTARALRRVAGMGGNARAVLLGPGPFGPHPRRSLGHA